MNDAYSNMDSATYAAIQDNRISQEESEYEKRSKIIEKATDGWKRYNFISLFRNVVEALVKGCDSWEIIERLLEMNTEMRDKIRKMLEQWPSPFGPNL